jgi:non-specific serine/threonine protein kinase
VFAGSFSLEAAEAVCAGGGIEATGILELIGRLSAKSLLQVEDQGNEAHYRLLETLRQYASERLQDSSEESEVRRKHVEYFLKLAETAEPELVGPRVGSWLARLDQDHDNFRAALQWCLERGESELGLRLAGAFYRFWLMRGFLTEGGEWLDRLLALPGAAAPSVGRAKAVNGAAGLASNGEQERALRLAEEAVDLWRTLGEDAGLASALAFMAVATYDIGRRTGSRTAADEARAAAEAAPASRNAHSRWPGRAAIRAWPSSESATLACSPISTMSTEICVAEVRPRHTPETYQGAGGYDGMVRCAVVRPAERTHRT